MFTRPKQRLKKRLIDMNSQTDMSSSSQELGSLSQLSETAFRQSQEVKEPERDLKEEDRSGTCSVPKENFESKCVYRETERFPGGGLSENLLSSYSDGIDFNLDKKVSQLPSLNFKRFTPAGTKPYQKPLFDFEAFSTDPYEFPTEDISNSAKSNFFKFDESRLRKSLQFVGHSSSEEEDEGNDIQQFSSRKPLHKSFSGQISLNQFEMKSSKNAEYNLDECQETPSYNSEPKKGKFSLHKPSTSACNLGAALHASESRVQIDEENFSQSTGTSYMDIRQSTSNDRARFRQVNLMLNEDLPFEYPSRNVGGNVCGNVAEEKFVHERSFKDKEISDRLLRVELGLARMQNELDQLHSEEDRAQSLKILDNKFEELFVNLNSLKKEFYGTDGDTVETQPAPAPQQKYKIVEIDEEENAAFCTPVINSDLAHAIFTAVLDRNVRELAIIIVQTEDGFYQLNIVTLENPERIACLLATGSAVEEAKDNGVFDYIPTFRFTCSCSCSKGMALWKSFQREMKM